MSQGQIILALIIIIPVGAALALVIGYYIGLMRNKEKFEERLRAEKETSEQRLLGVQSEQREVLREARDETARLRTTMERENSERRIELQRQERRLQQKEETLERKIDALEQRERKLTGRERSLDQTREELEILKQKQSVELERIAHLTEEQAKELLLTHIENQVRTEAAHRIRVIEEQAREEADARPPIKLPRPSSRWCHCPMTR